MIGIAVVLLFAGWNLVVGGDHTASEWVDVHDDQCQRFAIYGGQPHEWERWISDAPEHVNDLAWMVSGKAYWVYCQE